MKILKLLFILFLLFSYLLCHVEQDSGGLFTKISRGCGKAIQQDKVVYESRVSMAPQAAVSPQVVEPLQVAMPQASMMPQASCLSDSLVFNIQGMAQFTKLVVKNSYSKPVVLKIYSPMSQDSSQVTPVFQAIADEFKNQVIFAGLNVTQNMEIFMQISMFYKLKKVDLPLFLFYKDGQLLMPFLAGFQPHDYLLAYIQKRFSDSAEPLVDLTPSE